MTNLAPTDQMFKPPFDATEEGAMEQAIRQEIALVADRVERLLLRHDELQRTNELLSEQNRLLTQDRDSLRSRLSAARARVEALIERLPDNIAQPSHTQPGALG